MKEHYYNTTRAKGEQLALEISNAESQEEKILEFMRALAGSWPHCGFTPFEILDKVFDHQIPITSVRRAMTNLTKAGDLEKTDVQRMGPYNKPSYTWRLK